MRIASPKAIRNRLHEYMKREGLPDMTNGDLGAIVGEFERALEEASSPTVKDIANRRYLVWGFCFTPEGEPLSPVRSGDLTNGMIFALKKWVGFFKNDLDEWDRRESFQTEARQVLSIAEAISFTTLHSGKKIPLSTSLESMKAETYEILDGGIVQSAIEYLGGTASTTTEPPESYPSISTPAPTIPRTEDQEPEGGYIPL